MRYDSNSTLFVLQAHKKKGNKKKAWQSWQMEPSRSRSAHSGGQEEEIFPMVQPAPAMLNV